MLLYDVNVVLAAHRADHPHHDVALAELTQAGLGAEPFTVPTAVWGALLRLATHRKVFPVPSTVADVFAFLDAVRAQPAYVEVGPGPRHLLLLRQVCEASGATGDLVPDAVLAAAALEHGATVVTFDRDFGRFEAVAQRAPGQG